jgi:choline-sulfatase
MFDPDYAGTVTGANFIDDDSINAHLPPRDLDHLLALYDGEVRWVDDHIARILAAVDELGIADRTAIIVTADHGDEFFEHGSKGHGVTLYREVMQVPLVIRARGLTPGAVVDVPVSLTDVAPTVLALLGIEQRTSGNGVSLIGAGRGKALADRGPIYGVRCLGGQPGCRAMQHSTSGTLIHSFWPLGIEFYAPADPAQHNDLAGSSEWPRSQQLSLLTTALNRQWTRYRGAGGRRGTATVDAATRERLRKLGYE